MENPNSLAWHYTTGANFIAIAESGLLLPAVAGVIPPEKPVLWFSLNQYWEPTANKVWRTPEGKEHALDMWGTREKGGGFSDSGSELKKQFLGRYWLEKQKYLNPFPGALWKSGVNRGQF